MNIHGLGRFILGVPYQSSPRPLQYQKDSQHKRQDSQSAMIDMSSEKRTHSSSDKQERSRSFGHI